VTDIGSLERRISDLENRVKNLENSKIKKEHQKEKKSQYKGLTESIFGLIAEKFFDAPKELNEIHQRLKANAVFTPVTSYPKSLIRLIKNKELKRLKKNNKWKYVKYG